MKAIVLALLETALYSSAVAGGILLFRALFKKSISARLRYMLWGLLVLRMLIPFTIESGVHIPASGAVVPAPVPAPVAAPAAPAMELAPAAVIDRYAVAFWVWLAGAAISLLWMLAAKLRFDRRVRAAATECPEGTLRLFRECGAGEKVPLIITKSEISPAITLMRGRPTVILPEAMEGSALRFAMLHELTHYKSADHIVMLLSALLGCAYWFNPITHLALHIMREDMESACDARVLAIIAPEEKRDYLLTLLKLFNGHGEPALGMANASAKRTALNRMKGAFMKSKTALGAKLASGLLAMALAVCCFTTACQPGLERDYFPAEYLDYNVGAWNISFLSEGEASSATFALSDESEGISVSYNNNGELSSEKSAELTSAMTGRQLLGLIDALLAALPEDEGSGAYLMMMLLSENMNLGPYEGTEYVYSVSVGELMPLEGEIPADRFALATALKRDGSSDILAAYVCP